MFPTKVTEQLWKLNDDAWENREASWMVFWFGKKDGFWIQGLLWDTMRFEGNLLDFGLGSWLSIADEIGFSCSSSSLSHASSPASALCPVIVINSDFGVLFCLSVFTNDFLAEWLVILLFMLLNGEILIIFFIKLVIVFIPIDTFLYHISEDGFIITGK